MTYIILLTLCCIVLVAYLFEVTAKFSKIPGVILLLLTGMLLKYLAEWLNINLPDFTILLPVMGTLGLILIVLEGSLDLQIRRDNIRTIQGSFASAILLFFLFIALCTSLLSYYYNVELKIAILNSVPFAIISSAVAIPSSQQLSARNREFIVYESSMSDIIGILLFDFVLLNQMMLGTGLFFYSMEILATILVSIVISIGLAFILHKIGHRVKNIIILNSVVLVYVLAKLIHWPSLIVVLIFGLILNNYELFRKGIIRDKIDFQKFSQSLKSFKEITGELTFLVRSFFFLIFGFYTSLTDLLSLSNLFISSFISLSIFLLRALFLKLILHKPLFPLLFFAPRGLITILLFLTIPAELKLPVISEGVISQTIFITILVMTAGNMISDRSDPGTIKKEA